MLWIRSRSSAYHSSTSVRMRSTSVEASATTPRKPPRGFTCTTSTPSLMKTRRSSNACPQTTRTSWPRAASRVANWYARLSEPPTRAYARFVKRSFIVAPSEASRVVGETDDRRRRKGEPLACDEVPVLLYHARLLLGKEDHRAAHVAHVQRLKVEV